MKAKILSINADLFVQMCKPDPGAGWCLDMFGLPLDARIAEARVVQNMFVLKLVSDSWPEIEFGQSIPHLQPPYFKRIPQPGWTDPAAPVTTG